MKKTCFFRLAVILLGGVALFAQVARAQSQGARANRVYAYHPAPGQFVNTVISAYESGFSAADVLSRANEIIATNTGILSLGAYGGYVVLGWERRVDNVPGRRDFRVLGNVMRPTEIAPGVMLHSSEPGIIMVSLDVNANGKPDDPFYYIAGSEYASPQSIADYRITYHRPDPAEGDVKWEDNQGMHGMIHRNEHHLQASYYPLWIKDETLIFEGRRLPGNAQSHLINGITYWDLHPYEFGYADNALNNEEASTIDIDWAVDTAGKPVHLPGIDFVKIYTGVCQEAGWLGETSTEVGGLVDLHYTDEAVDAVAEGRSPLISMGKRDGLAVELRLAADATVSIFDFEGRRCYSKMHKTGTFVVEFPLRRSSQFIVRADTDVERQTLKIAF